MKRKFNAKAFTLIELLVVIAIVGVLSSVVISSLSSARSKSRDAQRKHDIYEINKAILLYMDDNGGNPPNPIAQAYDFDGGWTALGLLLKPYIAYLPKDPCGMKCSGAYGDFFAYYYDVSPATQKYSIYVQAGENSFTRKNPYKNDIVQNGYMGPCVPVPAGPGRSCQKFFGYNNIMGYQYSQ